MEIRYNTLGDEIIMQEKISNISRRDKINLLHKFLNEMNLVDILTKNHEVLREFDEAIKVYRYSE